MAAKVASDGVRVPTSNLRPVGARVRLTLELRSGETVVGEAVVDRHVRIREAPGISLRFVRLDPGGIVFPIAPLVASSLAGASAALSPAPAAAAPTPARPVPLPRVARAAPRASIPAAPPDEPLADSAGALGMADPFPGLDAESAPTAAPPAP